jgi:superfamily II DNA or RNA helicase
MLVDGSYLGTQGYTLLKKNLTDKQLDDIRNDLTINPFTMNGKAPPLFVYRESSKKIFVPHYYGLNKFGPPALKTKLLDGDDIASGLEFNGFLRENQVPIVEQFQEMLNKGIQDVGAFSGLLELYCGFGKTCLAIYLIAYFKKKTLIIVHKEFLMNQWIDQLNVFIPGIRVGKIQGKVFDIENKDVVLGMLQSLSMKEYPASAFSSFGFTIVDEVHHIASEVFSNSLFRIVTKRMLGLSATMNRKDGCTKVFKMFLGNVVAKRTREARKVTVRAIEYISQDEPFNKLIVDYKGQPAYSSMISKLCAFAPRTEFILHVLDEIIKNDPNQQIMILAHNKNILKYMHDAIESRSIATVGYYVGGMKRSALKETETKKIVIATYAMASEALDIKTLTTLIMATPKTDIEQSIGRILREKESNAVVYDIVDRHSLFKNQYKKRHAYYKKEKYGVYKIFSTVFTTKYESKLWKMVLAGVGNTCNPNKTSDSDGDGDGDSDGDSDSDGGDSKNNVGVCFFK